MTCNRCLKKYVGQTVYKFGHRCNNYMGNTRTFETGEHCMQRQLYEHFNLPGLSEFLNDVSVTLIDKTDLKNFWLYSDFFCFYCFCLSFYCFYQCYCFCLAVVVVVAFAGFVILLSFYFYYICSYSLWLCQVLLCQVTRHSYYGIPITYVRDTWTQFHFIFNICSLFSLQLCPGYYFIIYIYNFTFKFYIVMTILSCKIK